MSSNLAQQVRRQTKLALSRAGFVGHGSRPFTLRLTEDVAGWLGLNSAYYPHTDEVSILPVVGIRHSGVERFIAEMMEATYDPSGAPTVSTPIGTLMPREAVHRWVFSRNGDLSSEVDELVQAVVDFGIPFMTAHASLAALSRLAEGNLGHPESLAYRIPAIRLLRGDRAGAEEAIERQLGQLGNRTDPAAIAFRAFAERCRDLGERSGAQA